MNINTKIFFKDKDFRNNSFKVKYFKILKDKISLNKFKRFDTVYVHNFEKIQKKNYKKVFNFMNEIKKHKLTKKLEFHCIILNI